MARVTRKWIAENVETLVGFGGQIQKDDVLKMAVPKGGFDTTLTAQGIVTVERAEFEALGDADHQPVKFNINVCPGVWAEAWSK